MDPVLVEVKALWDYPMTAMNAARMGEPEKAVSALLMDKRVLTIILE